MNVLLVAGESAGIQVLRLLASSPYRLVGVLAAEPDPGVRTATVAGAARDMGVDVRPAELVTKPGFADRMRAQKVDLLLNVHSLFVIESGVVAAPRVGSFNLHPGPLPRYAGLNTPSWAIYEGEREHGCTLHWMDPGIDTGAIAYEASFDIRPNDTGLTLSARCVQRGIPLVSELLATAAREPAAIPRRRQDPRRRRYFGAGAPHGGWMPWFEPARRLVDLVRASDYAPFRSPWGYPRARLGADQVAIVRASMTGAATSEPPGTIDSLGETGVRVAAGDEWIAVERVELGGGVVDARDVLQDGRRFEPVDGCDLTPGRRLK